MGKIIEMNYKGEDGSYVVLWPRVYSNVVLNSQDLLSEFELEDGSNIDDVLQQINRNILLLQYNKAGVNVTVATNSGSPLSGLTINGITLNVDGTGSCITDEQGKCFGYCDAGQKNISVSGTYADATFNSINQNFVATQLYNINIIATVRNFMNYRGSTSVKFSSNVETIDVTVVGGGGGAYGGFNSHEQYMAGGGGGGYCVVQENVSFSPNIAYSLTVGSGGEYNNDGGASTFLNVSANGGKGTSNAYGGAGNGAGGTAIRTGSGCNGVDGSVYGYSSYTETTLYGGGGGGLYQMNSTSNPDTLGTGGKGYGKRASYSQTTGDNDATDGYGGGGGARYGDGGNGCVAIRMHLKATS